jgi:tetratricopeptide (TPR) repeat protein
MVRAIPRLIGSMLVVLIALAACSSAESRHDSHMKRGREYFAAESFEKARVEFSNALQITPDDAEARYMSGRVAEKLGDVRGALGAYQAAVDANPEHVAARTNLGRVFVFAGAPDRAMEVIEPALVRHPDNADLLTVRGAARVQLKDSKGAVDDAERAVKLEPANEGAVALLASLYRQSADPARAVELLTNSIAGQPQSVDLRLVLASMYLGASDRELAVAQFEEVVRLKPRVPAYRLQLALLLTGAGKVDEAERVLQEGVRKMAESRDMKLAYVDFLTAQRSREAGEKALREFIAKEPGDFELQLALGTLLDRVHDSKAAIAAYEQVIKAEGDRQQGLAARVRIAAIHAREGRQEQAGKLVDEVLASNPRDNDALILRGNLALEKNEPEKAVTDLRAVLRDHPDAVGVMRVLARAHLANGQAALAEEQLRNAMTLAPKVAAIRVELAQLLAQTQRVDQAIALTEETVTAEPNDLPARETLARLYLGANQLERARAASEDLKTLRPDLAAGYYLAGVVAAAQKRNADARSELGRAVELQPSAIDALAALTRLDLAEGHLKEATARAAAVVAKETTNAPAHNLLGELNLSARDYDAAQAQFQSAVKLAPKWWIPYRNLGTLHLAQKDVAGAIAAYGKGIEATQHQSAELVSDLATLHESQGQSEEAIRLYEAVLARRPDQEFASNNLAMLLVTYRKDADSFNRARDLTAAFGGSNDPALLDTFGWARFRRGDNSEALAALERASKLAPDSRVVCYHLGMAQIKAGQGDKAKQNLEKALSGSPSFTGIDEARASLNALQKRTG